MQIVENREGRLSGPFLGHGDIFLSKVMTKTDLDLVIANLTRKPDMGSILAVVLVRPSQFSTTNLCEQSSTRIKY